MFGLKASGTKGEMILFLIRFTRLLQSVSTRYVVELVGFWVHVQPVEDSVK